MFSKFYKLHIIFLVLGLIPIAFLRLFSPYKFSLEYELIAKMLSAVLFFLSLIFYYKIVSVLTSVSTITQKQMRIAILAHIVTLISLYFLENTAIFYIIFATSILMRSFSGVLNLDRQVKNLCKHLDLELFKIGKEQENEKN